MSILMEESNDSVMQEYDDYEPCVCIVCFQEFEHYDELEEHCQIHNGGKPPCCEICNQSFLNESDLTLKEKDWNSKIENTWNEDD
ncbi:zinc finger protein 782 [Caerostris extrusa]|uniref:Zinc finger protein 782 n=1 Tax=Caerostris extrusa TaxID=172846 RepID=A0AAV4NG32_CAEEX|nr:zinc finger protein 782 [Caerostris extrusa]